MMQPEMSPKPLGPAPQVRGQHIPGDDIELPPVPLPTAAATPVPGGANAAARHGEPRYRPQLWLAVGLIAALAIGNWWSQRSAPAESGHPNWSHVAAAAEASDAQGANLIVQRDVAGSMRVSPSVEVSLADAAPDTTRSVRDRLLRNDLAGASAALQAAQRLPPRALAQADRKQAQPVLGPNSRLLTAVRDGNAQFFQLQVLDCCDEDGDIVDISVNGEPLITVPLTHEGAIISVPLTPGTTVITLRGVYDGGGGITVLFQTSQGDFFCQPMVVGEEYQVGVIVK